MRARSKTKQFLAGVVGGIGFGFASLVGFSLSGVVIDYQKNGNEFAFTQEYGEFKRMENPHKPVLKLNPRAKIDLSQVEDRRGWKP